MFLLRKVEKESKHIKAIRVDNELYFYLPTSSYLDVMSQLAKLAIYSSRPAFIEFAGTLYRARCMDCYDDIAIINTPKSLFCEQCKSYESIKTYKMFPRWRWNG